MGKIYIEKNDNKKVDIKLVSENSCSPIAVIENVRSSRVALKLVRKFIKGIDNVVTQIDKLDSGKFQVTYKYKNVVLKSTEYAEERTVKSNIDRFKKATSEGVRVFVEM